MWQRMLHSLTARLPRALPYAFPRKASEMTRNGDGPMVSMPLTVWGTDELLAKRHSG